MFDSVLSEQSIKRPLSPADTANAVGPHAAPDRVGAARAGLPDDVGIGDVRADHADGIGLPSLEELRGANAVAGSPSALEVQVHGGPLIVPDVGPHLSAMVAAQGRAISELEDYAP
jgi:hypothetical protein